jgi:hypothetical protein
MLHVSNKKKKEPQNNVSLYIHSTNMINSYMEFRDTNKQKIFARLEWVTLKISFRGIFLQQLTIKFHNRGKTIQVSKPVCVSMWTLNFEMDALSFEFFKYEIKGSINKDDF